MRNSANFSNVQCAWHDTDDKKNRINRRKKEKKWDIFAKTDNDKGCREKTKRPVKWPDHSGKDSGRRKVHDQSHYKREHNRLGADQRSAFNENLHFTIAKRHSAEDILDIRNQSTGLYKKGSRAWDYDKTRATWSTRYGSKDNAAVYEHTHKDKERRIRRCFDDDGLGSEFYSKLSSFRNEEKVPCIIGNKVPASTRQLTLGLKSKSTYSLIKPDKANILRRRHSDFIEPIGNVEIREICTNKITKRFNQLPEASKSEKEVKEKQKSSRSNAISTVATRGKLKVFQKTHENTRFDERLELDSLRYGHTEHHKEASTSKHTIENKATSQHRKTEEAETNESSIDENLSGIRVVTKRGKDSKELFIRRPKNSPLSEDLKLHRKSKHNYSLEKIDMDVLVGSLSSAANEGMRNRSSVLNKTEFNGNSDRSHKKKSKSDVGPKTATSSRRKKIISTSSYDIVTSSPAQPKARKRGSLISHVGNSRCSEESEKTYDKIDLKIRTLNVNNGKTPRGIELIETRETKESSRRHAVKDNPNKNETDSVASQNEDVNYDALSLATSSCKTRLEKNMEGSKSSILSSRQKSMLKSIDFDLASNRDRTDPGISTKSRENGSEDSVETKLDALKTSGSRISNDSKLKEFPLTESRIERLSPKKTSRAAGCETDESSKVFNAKENLLNSTAHLRTFRKKPVIEKLLGLNLVNEETNSPGNAELTPMTLHRKLRERNISESRLSSSTPGISDASEEEDRKSGLDCGETMGRGECEKENTTSHNKNLAFDKQASISLGRRNESVANWVTRTWRSKKPVDESSKLDDNLSFIQMRKAQMEEDAVVERGKLVVTFTIGKDNIDSCNDEKICNDFATTCCSEDSTIDEFLTDTNSAMRDSDRTSALDIRHLQNTESLLDMPCDGNGTPRYYAEENEKLQDLAIKKQDSLLSVLPSCTLVDSIASSWVLPKTRSDDLSSLDTAHSFRYSSSDVNSREITENNRQHSVTVNAHTSSISSNDLNENSSPFLGCFHYNREINRPTSNTNHCKHSESNQMYEKKSLPPLSPIQQATLPKVTYPTDQSSITKVMELPNTSTSLWSCHSLSRSRRCFTSPKKNCQTTRTPERPKSLSGFSSTLRRVFSKTFHFSRVPNTPQVKVCKVRPFTQPPLIPNETGISSRKNEVVADDRGCHNREYSQESSVGSEKQVINISNDERISRDISVTIQSEASCIYFSSPVAPPVTLCSHTSRESLRKVSSDPMVKDLPVQTTCPLKNDALERGAIEKLEERLEYEEKPQESLEHKPPTDYKTDTSYDSGYTGVCTTGFVMENDQQTHKISMTDTRSHKEFLEDVAIQMENKEILVQPLEVKILSETGGIRCDPHQNREELVIDGQSTHSSDVDRSTVGTSECSIPSYRSDRKCFRSWDYDNSYPWYMWSGKGIGWKVILAPVLLIIGPLVWAFKLLNLNKRLSSCWSNWWRWDKSEYWFSCKGKGAGWILVLLPVYVIIGPLIIVFTILTVILLACCGDQGKNPAQARRNMQGQNVRRTTEDLRAMNTANPRALTHLRSSRGITYDSTSGYPRSKQ